MTPELTMFDFTGMGACNAPLIGSEYGLVQPAWTLWTVPLTAAMDDRKFRFTKLWMHTATCTYHTH